MTFQELLIFTYVGLFIYCCVYAVVNRICKCLEQRAMLMSYAKFIDANKGMDISKAMEALSAAAKAERTK